MHSLHMISGALAYDCPNTGATFIWLCTRQSTTSNLNTTC
jgi:predicted RNA-binding Zn-ribbon protein involved in translation (DUF1610 family)